MKPKQVELADWPTFDSPLLNEVADAFQHRSKSIRYQAGLSCERELSETPVGAFERLNFDLLPGSGDLRLSVWADGVMWLRLCVSNSGRNSGWAFMDQFYGDVQDISPASLVTMIEATIAEPFRPNSSDLVAYHERLRTIWQRVRPHDG